MANVWMLNLAALWSIAFSLRQKTFAFGHHANTMASLRFARKTEHDVVLRG